MSCKHVVNIIFHVKIVKETIMPHKDVVEKNHVTETVCKRM